MVGAAVCGGHLWSLFYVAEAESVTDCITSPVRGSGNSPTSFITSIVSVLGLRCIGGVGGGGSR